MNVHAWFVFLFIICLIGITYQDFKYRSVPVYVFAITFVVALVIQYSTCGMDLLFAGQVLCNTVFILVNFFIVFLYVKKIKRMAFQEAIGLGDVVFYIVLIPFLNTLVFVGFHVVSLLLILIAYPMLKNKLSLATRSIPLAGLQAICLIVLLALSEYVLPERSIVGSCSIIYWI